MADYDCEYCSKSTDCGGKCNRFEYNCPFLIVEKYDSEKLKLIREVVEEISESIERLRELDSEEYMEDEISSIKFQLSLFEDKISEDTEKEWNAIK